MPANIEAPPTHGDRVRAVADLLVQQNRAMLDVVVVDPEGIRNTLQEHIDACASPDVAMIDVMMAALHFAFACNYWHSVDADQQRRESIMLSLNAVNDAVQQFR